MVQNGSRLIVRGQREPFHILLRAPTADGTALPDLGVFVFEDELAIDYRMGPDWGPSEVAGFFTLLCQTTALAPSARVELEDIAVAGRPALASHE